MRGALDVANSRLHRLLPWAIVVATVTVILSRSRSGPGIVGQIVARLVGLAWNLVTFLTVPILVLEDLGVGDALKRSKDLFKQTWGENVSARSASACVGFLAVLPGLLADRHRRARSAPSALVVLGAVGVVVAHLASTVVVAALSGIYRTALYQFAATGEVPGDFAGIDFHGAFRPAASTAAVRRRRRGHRPAAEAVTALP